MSDMESIGLALLIALAALAVVAAGGIWSGWRIARARTRIRCPECLLPAMTARELAEHLRAQHGDS